MGYTIIKTDNDGKIIHKFIENLDAILDMDGINENTIIIEGIAKDNVKQLKDDNKYEQYYGDFGAGKKAEMAFDGMMTDKSFFIEKIDQSLNSMKKYKNEICKNNDHANKIKRPDFILLKHNICFEIKCYSEKNKKISLKEHFGLKCFQANTDMDVYLVIYEKNGDNIATDEKNEPIYFIVKNDDVYNPKDKNSYSKQTKTCNLIRDGLRRYESVKDLVDGLGK